MKTSLFLCIMAATMMATGCKHVEPVRFAHMTESSAVVTNDGLFAVVRCKASTPCVCVYLAMGEPHNCYDDADRYFLNPGESRKILISGASREVNQNSTDSCGSNVIGDNASVTVNCGGKP